jgi:hypothetical protein
MDDQGKAYVANYCNGHAGDVVPTLRRCRRHRRQWLFRRYLTEPRTNAAPNDIISVVASLIQGTYIYPGYNSDNILATSVDSGFAVGGMIVGYALAEGDIILRGGYAVGVMSVAGDYAVGGAFAVGDVSFAVCDAFTVGGMAMGFEVVVGVGAVAIVGGGMIVAVDCDVAQELANGPAPTAAPRTAPRPTTWSSTGRAACP